MGDEGVKLDTSRGNDDPVAGTGNLKMIEALKKVQRLRLCSFGWSLMHLVLMWPSVVGTVL